MGKPIVMYDLIDPAETFFFTNNQVPGFPATAAMSPFTYDVWRMEGGVTTTLDITFFSAIRADTLCWLGMSPKGPRYTLEAVPYGASHWVTVIDNSSSRTGANMGRFPIMESKDWRLSFKPTSDDFDIANITLGLSAQFQRCIMDSHAPLPFNRQSEYTTNESGTGNFLGRSLVRRNVSTDVEIQMMTDDFARTLFQDFARHAQKKPFYFAWNYDDYPEDVGYVWADDDIGFSYTGDELLTSANFSIRGISRNEPV